MTAKSIGRVGIVTLLILLVPLVLTLINPTSGMNGGQGGGWDWEPGDFLTMGVLIFCTGMAIEFAIRKITVPSYRIIAVGAIIVAFLLLWVELATDAVSRTLGSLVS